MITEDNQVLEKIYNLFKIDKINQVADIKTHIKTICIVAMCEYIGINCKNCLKSDFFDFFACLTGEALCEMYNLPFHMCCADLRLVKYDGKNLVKEIIKLLKSKDIDEAMLDIFDLIDKYKNLMKIIDNWNA